jgi:hypothetical protein
MNETQFVELLHTIPTETDEFSGRLAPDFRLAFKIYIISHGLLPSVFFESSVTKCLAVKKCRQNLDDFFRKYELPLNTTDQMIYNVHLMSKQKQAYLKKKYGFSHAFIGKALGYPHIVNDDDLRALYKKKNNPYYEVEYIVRFRPDDDGLQSEWLTGWFFKKPNESTPSGHPHFLHDLLHVLKQLKVVYDVEQHIKKCPC